MGWKAYQLVFKAMSPLHIGLPPLGYIKRTRRYIPGRTMWGALTAALARSHGDMADSYTQFGRLFQEQILVSYFFPGFSLDHIYLPAYTPDGLVYGDPCRCATTEADFERMFIHSFGQTAIEPKSNTAEDESLHETELVSHQVRFCDQIRQVLWFGYLLMKDPCEIGSMRVAWRDGDINLLPALGQVFVGGDISYGNGRMMLHNQPDQDGEKMHLFGYRFHTKEQNGVSIPCLHVPPDAPVPAHLHFDSDIRMQGDIEPLLGRRWVASGSQGKKEGAGQGIDRPDICWTPGSIAGATDDNLFRIHPFGMLSPM